MTERATVGVAVPVYDGERFLAETLHSVLAQTYPVEDVLVLDDGSEDASAEIAMAFGPPIRVVSRSHAGIGVARSEAIRLVRGEFVVPLDADDLLTADSIGSRIGLLLARPELDVVFGRMRNFSRYAGEAPLALDELRPAHVPDSMLIRRAAFERVGPFAGDLAVGETLDWLLRARELGLREASVPAQVLWRRVHGTNTSLTRRRSLSEYPRVLKASLDRRRAGQG